MACRITGAEIAHGRADQQRQRRCDGNDRVLRAAEEPEDEPRKQAGVKTRLRRESSQRRVSDSRGQQVRGKREAGDQIRPQPRVRYRAATAAQRGRRATSVCSHHRPPCSLNVGMTRCLRPLSSVPARTGAARSRCVVVCVLRRSAWKLHLLLRQFLVGNQRKQVGDGVEARSSVCHPTARCATGRCVVSVFFSIMSRAREYRTNASATAGPSGSTSTAAADR